MVKENLEEYWCRRYKEEIMTQEKLKEYIYIVQASNETSRCKIGVTNDLERRLKEYNSITGKSKNNIYQYRRIGKL
jgi:predicted GIY-YIG superfamily endonuclease